MTVQRRDHLRGSLGMNDAMPPWRRELEGARRAPSGESSFPLPCAGGGQGGGSRGKAAQLAKRSPGRKRTRAPQRAPAQILLFFAIGLVGMVALAGIVLDGGTAYVERRTAQNAADASALAGVRLMGNATTSTTVADIGTAIASYVTVNAFGHNTQLNCAYFVGTDGTTALGGIVTTSGTQCAGAPSGATTTPTTCTTGGSTYNIPCDASGVHVETQIGPYNTYLLGIVGQGTATIGATATAQLGSLSSIDGDLAPLAGCGSFMVQNTVSNGTAVGIDIVGPAVYPTPDAYPTPGVTVYTIPRLTSQIGMDFVLQDSQLSNSNNQPPEACPNGSGNSNWKGKIQSGNDNTDSTALTVPGAVPVSGGNAAANVASACTGTGQSDPASLTTAPTSSTSVCRLIVPISSIPAGYTSVSGSAFIVGFACFDMYSGGGGTVWRGVLLSDAQCPVYGSYSPGATFGSKNGPLKVMLSN